MSNTYGTIQKIVLTETQSDNVQPQDEITFVIDGRVCPMINGRNSYLQMTVRLSGSSKANLDRNGGGGYSLIDRFTVYDGTGQTMLEQIEDWGVWQGTKNYYDKSTGLTNMRELLEGVSPLGNKSPYFTTNALVQSNAAGNGAWTDVQLCLPLYASGVFYGDTVFPCVAANGLRVVIRFAAGVKAICKLGTEGDGVNGFVNSRLGTGVLATLNDLPFLPGLGPVGAQFTPAAGEPSNPQDIAQCFELAADIAIQPLGPLAIRIQSTAGPVAAPFPALRPNVPAPDGTIAGANEGGEFPWCVGDNMGYLTDANTIKYLGPIQTIAWNNAGYYDLTFINQAITAPEVATAANSPCAFVCNPTIPTAQQTAANGFVQNSYSLRDIQLVLSCVNPSPQELAGIMEQMKREGGVQMDIKTWNMYRNNLYARDVKTQLLLPTTARRAKALFQAQIFPVLTWNTSFYRPIHDFQHDYIYQIKNKSIPQREVLTNREAPIGEENTVNPLCDAERIKMLTSSKVDVKSEIHPAGHFVFGRQVAKTGYSSNLNGIDTRITQSFGVTELQGTAFAPTVITAQKDKLLYTLVYHFRQLNMELNNVVVNF